MAQIELANELDVAEELVLALHLDVAVVFKRVLLATILGLLLECLKILL